MPKARTILLPSQNDGWEVWSCGASSCALKKTVATPVQARAAGAGTVIGIPGRHCRTLGLKLPASDPAILRKMAFSQLERRGLARGPMKQTLFDCHQLPDGDAGNASDSCVSVDVLSDLPADFELPNARGYTATARLFPLPGNKLVLWREHGQLILSASRNGRLVHSQVIGPVSRLQNGAAQEINLTRIALENDGLIDRAPDGLEVWADDISEEALAPLRACLDMPIDLRPRPDPSCELASMETAGKMVPDSVHATRRRHRRAWMTFCLIIALAMAYMVVLYHMKRGVEGLEAQIPQLERQVNQTRDVAERVKRAQARWNTLLPVLEPKRYPLVHLSHIARVMPRGGVRISDFQSKISEVKLQGEARDAGSAYEMLRLLQADPGLDVYNWSMPQPSVQNEGQATFEINGKLR